MDGQGSNDSLVPGDWFSYKLAIDLPGIPSNKPKMLKIELLTNDPVSGKTYHCVFYIFGIIQEIQQCHLQPEKTRSLAKRV